MTDELIMRYVYFDALGNIRSFRPAETDEEIGCNYIMLPMSEVIGFITCEKNPFDYTVKLHHTSIGSSYQMVKKTRDISYTRVLDNYLTKIDITAKENGAIHISNNILERYIRISLGKPYVDDYYSDRSRNTVGNFIDHGPTHLYFTKKNNPYFLLETFSFIPRELIEGQIKLKYTSDLSNASLYTRKITDKYTYQIKEYSTNV